MLDIKINKGECKIEAQGFFIEITADLGCIVRMLYTDFKKSNAEAAKQFKKTVQYMFSDEAPTWEDDGSEGGRAEITEVSADIDEIIKRMGIR